MTPAMLALVDAIAFMEAISHVERRTISQKDCPLKWDDAEDLLTDACAAVEEATTAACAELAKAAS